MDVVYLEIVVFFYDFQGFGGTRSTWGKSAETPYQIPQAKTPTGTLF